MGSRRRKRLLTMRMTERMRGCQLLPLTPSHHGQAPDIRL